jgi:hypothetical protein
MENKKTVFVKPSYSLNKDNILDSFRVENNKKNGIETTLALDTNILIEMERVVKNGNDQTSLEKSGLSALVNLLERCPAICISPGIAFNEMPPELANQASNYYELFCKEHLPSFRDTANCTHREYAGKREGYGYLDLEFKNQVVLAIPFVSLLYLNLVDKKFAGNPLEKFKEFLRRVSCDLDFLSAKEIEIAKYCLAIPPAPCVKTISRRKILRNNFLKTKRGKNPKNFEEVMAIAFNGACDLSLINSANIMDLQGIKGIKQDVWIATQDQKLVEFTSIFQYVNVGDSVGEYAAINIHPEFENDSYWQAAIDIHPEFKNDSYWQSVTEEHQILIRSREKYHSERKADPDELVATAKNTIAELRSKFDGA